MTEIMNGWVAGQINGVNGWIDRWMDEYARMNEGLMDGWVDVQG